MQTAQVSEIIPEDQEPFLHTYSQTRHLGVASPFTTEQHPHVEQRASRNVLALSLRNRSAISATSKRARPRLAARAEKSRDETIADICTDRNRSGPSLNASHLSSASV